MNLARVPDFETNLCLDIVLHHSLNRLYIENPKSAALGSHGIPELTKQKLLSIVKVKTAFDSFFRVEKMSQWCRLFVSTRSACGHQKRSAEPQGHQIRSGLTGNTCVDSFYKTGRETKSSAPKCGARRRARGALLPAPLRCATCEKGGARRKPLALCWLVAGGASCALAQVPRSWYVVQGSLVTGPPHVGKPKCEHGGCGEAEQYRRPQRQLVPNLGNAHCALRHCSCQNTSLKTSLLVC